MALSVGRDNAGDWAAVECDRRGCFGHVAVRPAEDMTGYDLVCVAFDLAAGSGWTLTGSAYCPKHPPRATRRRLRLADGFPWVRVAR